MPRGSAHEASAPSCSSRRSQCRCGRGAPAPRSGPALAAVARPPRGSASCRSRACAVAVAVGHPAAWAIAGAESGRALAQLLDRVEHDGRAGLAQLRLGEAAGEHRDRLDAPPARRPRSPRSSRPPSPPRRRRPCRSRPRPGRARASWPRRRRSGPGVGELARVEQVEVVVDLVGLGRAGQHHGVAALLQVLDQLARAREAARPPRSAPRSAPSRRRGCRRPSRARPRRRRGPRPAGRRPCRCGGGCARRAAARRARGRPGTRRARGGSWCRPACRRRRGSLRVASESVFPGGSAEIEHVSTRGRPRLRMRARVTNWP